MQYQYESNSSQRNQNSISSRIKQTSTKSNSSMNSLKKVSDRLSCAQQRVKYLEKNEESLSNISQILEDLEVVQIPQFKQKMHIIDSSNTTRSPFKKQQDNQISQYQNIENSINKVQFSTQSKLDLILNEIQNKMNFLLQQGENAIDRQIKYINNKILQYNYYPFIKENNHVILKILIMILYDELEKFYIIDNGSTVNLRLQIENLEKTIQNSKQTIMQLNEELIEKNIKITNLTQKQNSNQQRNDDLNWIFDESKQLFENFMKEIQEINFQDDRNRSKLVQFNNIYNEYKKLKNKFQGNQERNNLDNDNYNINNQTILNNPRQSVTPTRERVSSNFGLKSINKFENIKVQLSNIEDEYYSQQETLQEQLDNYKKIYQELLKKNEFIKDQYEKLEQQFLFYKQNTCEISAFQNIQSEINNNKDEIKSLQLEYEKLQKCNIQLEKNNQNLISQQLDIQNIKLEKNKLQNQINYLQSENDTLKKEQQELFELLTNSKINLENIKNEICLKEQEKQGIQIKYKESLSEINILQQKIQNFQYNTEDINQKIEVYKKSFDSDFQQKQILILDQLQMFFMNKQNSNIELSLDNQQKQLIKNIYGDRFLKIIEFLSSIIQNNQQNYIKIVQKHHETLQEKLISQEDIVFLGQTMLKACEIFSRQQNNKLPTDVLMVREDFEQKKTIIYDKIRDASNSIKVINDYLQKVNMEERILTENNELQQWSDRINNLLDVNFLDTQQEQSRLSIAEKFQIQEFQNENLLLKQRIDALVVENSFIQDQLMMVKRNDSLNSKNNYSSIKNQNSRFLKSDRSASCFNELEDFTNSNQLNQNQAGDDMISMLFMQATSIEQLINVKR